MSAIPFRLEMDAAHRKWGWLLALGIALLILGTIEHAVGRTGQAESRYREIISSYRSSSALQGAYVGLGRLLADGGRSYESVDNFRKALAVPAAATDSMFALTGIGNGSTYKMIPAIFTSRARANIAEGRDEATELAMARRISGAVRLRLSVAASTRTATPPGP